MIKIKQVCLLFLLKWIEAAEIARPGEIPDLYTIEGQQNWSGECQTSFSQSPIDVDESLVDRGWMSWEHDTFGKLWTVEAHNWLKKLGHHQNSEILKMKLADIGPSSHAIKYTPDEEPEFCFLNTCVKLAQFHFHILNSEHAWNNELAFAEVHYVTYRSDMFGDLTEAVVDGKPGNLRVFGYFIEPMGEDMNSLADHHFEQIYHEFENKNYGANASSNEVNLIVASDISSGFARYDGGLTTPTCNEIVTWTVFKQPIYVGNSMAEKLAGLPMNLQHNNRLVQPWNDRKIKLFRDPYFEHQNGEETTKNRNFQLFHYLRNQEEQEVSQRIGQINFQESSENVKNSDLICLEATKKGSIKQTSCKSPQDPDFESQSFHLSKNGLRIVQGFGGNRKCLEFTNFSEDSKNPNLEYLISLRKCASTKDNEFNWDQAFSYDREKGMLMAFNDNRWCAGFNKERKLVLRPCYSLMARQAGIFGVY